MMACGILHRRWWWWWRLWLWCIHRLTVTAAPICHIYPKFFTGNQFETDHIWFARIGTWQITTILSKQITILINKRVLGMILGWSGISVERITTFIGKFDSDRWNHLGIILHKALSFRRNGEFKRYATVENHKIGCLNGGGQNIFPMLSVESVLLFFGQWSSFLRIIHATSIQYNKRPQFLF